MLRLPEALQIVQDEVVERFWLIHLDYKSLLTSTNADTTLLLCISQQDLTNPGRPKVDFPVQAFYKAGAKYISALKANFAEICRDK